VEHFFEQIIVKYQARLRAYIAGIGVPVDAVDDIAQEAFIRYYQTPDKRPEEVDVLPWLKGIARNISFNYFRSESRRAKHQQAAAEILDKAPSFNERAAEEKELNNALQDCLETLPEKSRAMVDLRYNQGCNSQQIAEELKGTAEAIRMALMRVRSALKACIEGKLGGEVGI
jgi:RNA polymerase sigma-70 factor (ECF subfamily)